MRRASSRRGGVPARLAAWAASAAALLLIVLLGLGHVQRAGANVMGIDLGSEFMKVSLVKPGSMMDIVTNIHSKRKTESMVSFYQGERSYGADAYSLLTRKPEVTYARLPTLLGRQDDHPAVALLDAAYFPTKVGYNQTRGGLAIHHPAPAQDEMPAAFTPEEMVAMILTHAKDITRAYGGVPVRDAVLVVPAFYTQPERQALMDAAEIADIKVLGLMDENAAAALLFAVDNVYEEPTNIVFYNLGASSLQVSLVEMSSWTTGSGKNEKRFASFTVKAKAWDQTLGGFQFDLRVAELLADRFNEKWAKTSKGKGKDVRAHHKAMAKIRAQAKKVKEVLSANSNIPVHIEGVHDDIDLSTSMSRAELEAMCEDLLERAVQPLDAVLQQANVTLDQVAAFEVIGGGVRVPKVQSVLREKLKGTKLDLSMHLNGDEAMAQGASFYAANISTRFKVRPIGVTDILPFGVGARIEEAAPADESGKGGLFGKLGLSSNKKEDKSGDDGSGEKKWQKRATIFGAGHRLKANRTISFNTSQDLSLNLTYESTPLFPQGAQPTIALYDIRGVAALAKEHGSKSAHPPKVFLTFELDASGMVHLVRAEARIVEDPVDGSAAAAAAPSTPATDSGAAEVGDRDEAAAEDEKAAAAEADAAAKAAKTAAASSSNDTDASSSGSNATDAKPATPAEPATPKPVVHRATLTVKAHYEGLALRPHTAEEKALSAAKLAALRARDELRREKADARNSLEGYLYDVRNKLADQEEAASQVSTEEQRGAVLAAVEAADDWMYEEGRDVAASVYQAKKAEVATLAQPIFVRMAEGPLGGLRAAAVEAGRKNVAEVRALVKKWNVTMPWLSANDTAPLLEEASRVETWLAEQETAQAQKEGHEEPAFLSTDVEPQLKKMKDIARRLGRKPAPPPPPKPKAASNKTAEAANGTATAAEGEGAEGGSETVNVKTEEEGAGDKGDGGEEAEAEATTTTTPAGDEL